MKKFKKENLLLFLFLLLLGGGFFLFQVKEKVPLWLANEKQTSTKKMMTGNWYLQTVIDEESQTVKNVSYKKEKSQRINLEEKGDQEFLITNALLKKSYPATLVPLKKDLSFPEEDLSYKKLTKKVDGLLKIYHENKTADHLKGLLIKENNHLEYLVLGNHNKELYWYNGETLEIFLR